MQLFIVTFFSEYGFTGFTILIGICAIFSLAMIIIQELQYRRMVQRHQPIRWLQKTQTVFLGIAFTCLVLSKIFLFSGYFAFRAIHPEFPM
jgi:hypothetical protein